MVRPHRHARGEFAESIPVRDFPVEKKQPFGKIRELEHFEKDETADGEYGGRGKRRIADHSPPDVNAPRTPDRHFKCRPSINAPSQIIRIHPQLISRTVSADTIAVGQGFLPPDTNGDVGPPLCSNCECHFPRL